MNKIISLIMISSLFAVASPTAYEDCSKYISCFQNYHCVQQQPIGTGSTGLAYLIKKNGVKYILKKQLVSQRSQNELHILMNMRKVPYVVQLIDAREMGNVMVMILEYGSQGSVIDFLDNSDFLDSYGNVLRFFRKILVGVEGIIEKGVIHSDLKLDNIVVDSENNPFIIDFDLAVNKNEMARGRGTLSYASPEILSAMSRKEELRYTEAIDVYSLGVIFYALLTGELPFEIKPNSNHNLGIMLTRSILVFEPGLPEDAIEIVLMCLQKKENRLSLGDVMKRVDQAIFKPSHKVSTTKQEFTMEKMRQEKLRLIKMKSSSENSVSSLPSGLKFHKNDSMAGDSIFATSQKKRESSHNSELGQIFNQKYKIDQKSTIDESKFDYSIKGLPSQYLKKKNSQNSVLEIRNPQSLFGHESKTKIADSSFHSQTEMETPNDFYTPSEKFHGQKIENKKSQNSTPKTTDNLTWDNFKDRKTFFVDRDSKLKNGESEISETRSFEIEQKNPPKKLKDKKNSILKIMDELISHEKARWILKIREFGLLMLIFAGLF